MRDRGFWLAALIALAVYVSFWTAAVLQWIR